MTISASLSSESCISSVDRKVLFMSFKSCFSFMRLTRIFHHSRDEKAAKADGARQTKNFYQGCMSPYCPDQNSSLTQHPSDFPAFAVERDEIFGLTKARSAFLCLILQFERGRT